MVKVSSRDILDVLRRYELANDDNVPRHIETIKISHPSPISTLVSFYYAKKHSYLLFDDTADDDVNYILMQIKTKSSNITGELIKNPKNTKSTYAIPFKGKACYLFIAISEKRFDVELAKRNPKYSRSTWQKHIKAGYVTINDVVITSPKHKITDADKITINIPDVPNFSKNELAIIYMNDNVIVVNKPCGVLSHAKGVLNEEFTVADFFRRYTTYNLDSNRSGIVHRLDRDTSGVMIGARNLETALFLQKQFSNRMVKKVYLAILDGTPKLQKANVDLPIERNPSNPGNFRVGSNGKSAITRYEIIDSNGKYSVVKLQPQTGRTHQLRVHMKYLNTPILGDRVYNNPSNRLFLHAYSIEIAISNGNTQVFVAPIPESFIKLFPGVKL
jgi:23S rRNA pseudouridine1911/1915/1917 synthase